MTKEVKNNLSKCKYLYRIYKENTNFHIEKYPIVYINSECVYFKIGRKQEPGREYIRSLHIGINVKESFDKAIYYLNNNNYSNYVCFIEIDKLKEFDLSLIKQRLKEESKKSELKEQEEKVKEAKLIYELELNELEKMKKEYEMDGDKN